MFPNLEAEQARKGHINAQVAEKLNMSRRLYEIKKKNGTFIFPVYKKEIQDKIRMREQETATKNEEEAGMEVI